MHEEQYIRKKTRILNVLRFWVESDILTLLYKIIMVHWYQITLAFF